MPCGARWPLGGPACRRDGSSHPPRVHKITRRAWAWERPASYATGFPQSTFWTISMSCATAYGRRSHSGPHGALDARRAVSGRCGGQLKTGRCRLVSIETCCNAQGWHSSRPSVRSRLPVKTSIVVSKRVASDAAVPSGIRPPRPGSAWETPRRPSPGSCPSRPRGARQICSSPAQPLDWDRARLSELMARMSCRPSRRRANELIFREAGS